MLPAIDASWGELVEGPRTRAKGEALVLDRNLLTAWCEANIAEA